MRMKRWCDRPRPSACAAARRAQMRPRPLCRMIAAAPTEMQPTLILLMLMLPLMRMHSAAVRAGAETTGAARRRTRARRQCCRRRSARQRPPAVCAECARPTAATATAPGSSRRGSGGRVQRRAEAATTMAWMQTMTRMRPRMAATACIARHRSRRRPWSETARPAPS